MSYEQKRAPRIAPVVEAGLEAATTCLVVVAICLATLLFVKIQVMSWGVGAIGGDPAFELEVIARSP